MARSTTSAQDTALAALDRKDLIRVSIEDGASSMVHYTRIGGGERDWVRSWQVERDADQPAGRWNVTLHPTSIVARYAADVVASTDTFTSPNHGLANGDTVYVDGTSLPAGLSANTLYYIISVSGDDYKLSATRGGSAVDVTADGSCSVVHTRYIAPTSSTASANDIKEGRDILIECAVVDIDTDDADVASGEWQELLSGRLDGTDWPQDVNTHGRDDFGRLIDEWVETPTVYATGGVAQETVMQNIVNDHLSVALTLDVPTSPAFTVNEYENRIQSVADALIAHSNLTGWTVHDLWDDGSSAWVTRYYEPDRNKTTPDRTIDSDDYYVVGDIRRDTSSVRNVGIMEWQAGSFVTVEDTSSIAEFGRLPIFGDASSDPQIDTSGKATTLITAAVNDLAQPLVRAEIRGPLYWPVQLGDLIRFTADVRHLEEDTDFAVKGFVHRGSDQGNETVFRLQGKPSGGVDRWGRFFRKTTQKQEVGDIVPDLGTDTIIPTVDWDRAQAGSTGTLTITALNDPDGLVDATAWDEHSGGGDHDFDDDPANWAVFDAVAPFTLSEDVPLSRGHNSVVAGAARYTIAGVSFWIKRFEVFDLDTVPEVEIQSISRDPADDHALISVKGDEDTADVRFTWTIGNGTSEPADPIITDTNLVAASGTLDTGAVAEAGDIVWVKARGEDAGGNLAPTNAIAEAKHEVAGVPDGDVTNDSFAASLKIAVDKVVSQAAGFATDINVRAEGEDQLRWDAGSIWFADGTEQAITQNTGYSVNGSLATTGTWFVYWDGTQITDTQTYTTAIASSENNILLATVTRSVNTTAWTVWAAIGVLGVVGAPIQTEHLQAGVITADKIAANSVTATKISVVSLDAIAVDAGIITAGLLQNASGTRFIDLDAASTDPFIKHDNFELLADGTATFSGALSAASGTFAGDLSAAGGTFSGTVAASSFTATTATFDGAMNIEGGRGSTRVTIDALLPGAGGGGRVTFNPGEADEASMSMASAGHLRISGDSGVLVAGVAEDLGFYGATPAGQPTVTGSRGGNAALASLLTELDTLGLIVDNSS